MDERPVHLARMRPVLFARRPRRIGRSFRRLYDFFTRRNRRSVSVVPIAQDHDVPEEVMQPEIIRSSSSRRSSRSAKSNEARSASPIDLEGINFIDSETAHASAINYDKRKPGNKKISRQTVVPFGGSRRKTTKKGKKRH